MADDVLNRSTVQFIRSVHASCFPAEDWIINPDLSGVFGVPEIYWVITGDVVSEMSQPQKDAVDAAIQEADRVLAMRLRTIFSRFRRRVL